MIAIIDLREGSIDKDKSKLGSYEHSGGSGKKIIKYFCKNCAAPILTFVERWNKFYLYARLLNDISLLKKANNIFFENSHFSFFDITNTELNF